MNHQIGIDAIDFYVPNYYLDLEILAQKRDIDVNKFHVGLGQFKMALPAPCEDIVTMGANAAYRLLKNIDLNDIETVLFATESAFDQSKSGGTYLHRLLNLPLRCRVVELKQACYGMTAALKLGSALLLQNPSKKILIIASDIAKYSLHSAAESSQGSGAVAMILSTNPRMIALESGSGLHTEDVMDFWRPQYKRAAIVEGKYSSTLYLKALESSWTHFKEVTGRTFKDLDIHCYHSPVPRLVEKAHKLLARINQQELSDEAAKSVVADSLVYSRLVGNSYTAALYVNLISALENKTDNLAGKRIGFYSYGSGCMAEYFSGMIQPEYKSLLKTETHKEMLAFRHPLSYEDYETFYHFRLPEDGSKFLTPHQYKTGDFRLAGIEKHKRIYEKIT
ncbi:MAG: hydroxymethylglutaryl-CoA synthase [Gammaproteobacteria bacterium]|nr:hydroxymethylglutaryl-CoA synthase [Gammaproteobacteria bacterium]